VISPPPWHARSPRPWIDDRRALPRAHGVSESSSFCLKVGGSKSKSWSFRLLAVRVPDHPRRYASVARRSPILDRSPEFTERMAWISAKHPRTFSGLSRRFSRRRVRARLADFRLFVPPFWPSTIESSHFLAFCSLDILTFFFETLKMTDSSGVRFKTIDLAKKSDKNLREVVPDRRIGLNIECTASQQHQKARSCFSHATGSEAQLVPTFRQTP
jgi:hypothetical protein